MTDREIFNQIKQCMFCKNRGLKLDLEQELAITYMRGMCLQRKLKIAYKHISRAHNKESSIRDVNEVLELELPFTDYMFDEGGVFV